MGKRSIWSAAFVLLAVAGLAHAEGRGPRAVRGTIEASVLVTGNIDVDAAGRVTGYAIDRSDDVPAEVVQLLAQAVPMWTFEPTLRDGVPAAVHTSMRVRVAANRRDDDILLRVAGADFGDYPPGEAPMGGKRTPPVYPKAALHRGVTGTVYVLARVARDGSVDEVIAEQVNLRFVAGENEMARWRKVLAASALRAARHWTFETPTRGEEADADSWAVRVPVDFRFKGEAEPAYGEWEAYIPGPRQVAAWVEDDTATGADAFALGGVYLVGAGLKLLTPLGTSG